MNEIRPVKFDDIPGQEYAKKQLIEACQSAKMGKSLDHICIVGPRGLGKTSMAAVIANELGGKLVCKDASDIKSKADFVNMVLRLEPKDVLLIDEIHGLKREVEESMYRILDDKVVDVKLKSGDFIPIQVPHLSIIGASTLPSEISEPLRSRFGLWIELEYYTPEQLAIIAKNNANRCGYNIGKEAALEIGKRARGTARLVNNLLSRVIDSCLLAGITNIDKDIVIAKMDMLGIDEYGLGVKDRKMLKAMDSNGPMGIQALAATIGEDVKNVAGNIEPFLMHINLIKRTPKGRVLTELGKDVLLCAQY